MQNASRKKGEPSRIKGKATDLEAVNALKKNVDALSLPEPTKLELLLALVRGLFCKRGKRLKKADCLELVHKASNN